MCFVSIPLMNVNPVVAVLLHVRVRVYIALFWAPPTVGLLLEVEEVACWKQVVEYCETQTYNKSVTVETKTISYNRL